MTQPGGDHPSPTWSSKRKGSGNLQSASASKKKLRSTGTAGTKRKWVDSRLNFHASVKGKQRYISATCGCEVVAIAWRRSFACWVRVMGRGVGHSVGGSVIIDATQDMKA